MKKCLMLLLLILSALLCFTACGDDDDDDSSSKKKKKPTEEVTEAVTDTPTPAPEDGVTIASTETWGDLTVGIPADWKFRKGDAFDEEDTRYCSVKKSDFKYFDFSMTDAELAKQHYDYNKNTYTNEQVDVSGTYGSINWEGFQYSDGWGGYGFELIATASNGKIIRVSSCGFKFDSEEAKAVLGSVVIQ